MKSKNIKSEETKILKQSEFIAKSAADFDDEEPEFVWYPYIPRGEYTVLMADAATGSTDFINAARSAIKIIFSEEPSEENVRIAVHTKSNHASAGQSLKYRITHQKGLEYIYSEGAVTFPDKLNQPARTMLTSEGTVNRSSHVITAPQTNKLRTITPIEAERIQGFDDNWTVDMPDRMRYFCMGNPLVVPMITRMARVLDSIVDKE